MEERAKKMKHWLATQQHANFVIIAEDPFLKALIGDDARVEWDGNVKKFEFNGNKGSFSPYVHKEVESSYDDELEAVGALD